jgi:hypothetical protein
VYFTVSSFFFCDRLLFFSARVLRFFGADPDEYDVVFTSGATAAIKLVFENFDFCADDGELYYPCTILAKYKGNDSSN